MPVVSDATATTVRRATFSDYEQMVSLESRYGLATKSYDEWRHLWLENPAYQECGPDWPIGWVVEDRDKRIVASLGNIPLLYVFEGTRILACSGRALVAEPQHRGASLLLLDRLINHSDAGLYLNNTVGLESAESFGLFGCPRVPVGAWDRAAFWVTHYHEFFEAFMSSLIPRAAKPLSYPISAAAFLRDRLIASGLGRNDVEVQCCRTFDCRFDCFWDELSAAFPHLLLAVRTANTLAWHFKYALLQDKLWIATVSDRSRLVAYAIFERKDTSSPAVRLRRMRLVEFQSLDGSTALLLPILSWALQRCREEGLHLLEVVGRWLEKGELLNSLAPYHRNLSTWTFFYRANYPALARRLADRSAWAPSLYDGDATL